MRIIMHMDLDAFFAACEIRERPELSDKPVVIGADPKAGRGRGVVSTANYIARGYGVHSGMPISQAYRLCPNGIYLPVNFELYWTVSSNIMTIARRYADKFQQSSIDEAFLDVSGCGSYEEAERAAKKLKIEILEKERLTCSIGIGPNKLVAKIASDFQKPDGLTVVREEGVKKFLFPLPVRKLHGVGKKTEQVLKSFGISTVEDLAKYDKNLLVENFGKWGLYMHLIANGIDDSEIIEEEGIQSIGREVTFDEDTNDILILNETIDAMSDNIYSTIKDNGIIFRTIVLKIRYQNFETHTKQKTLMNATDDIDAIRSTAKDLLTVFMDSKKKVRLIGVRVTSLSFSGQQKRIGEYL